MPPRRFLQLDVFADRLFAGNPLAVVVDAEGLDGASMQRIARWTNLSETAFLLPPTQPQADYRVRIFTPRQELPFAGHPSVGSAYAAIEAGLIEPGKRALIQQCSAGLLPVRVNGDGAARIIHVQAPPARWHDTDDALRARLLQHCIARLGVGDRKRAGHGRRGEERREFADHAHKRLPQNTSGFLAIRSSTGLSSLTRTSWLILTLRLISIGLSGA